MHQLKGQLIFGALQKKKKKKTNFWSSNNYLNISFKEKSVVKGRSRTFDPTIGSVLFSFRFGPQI